MNMKDTIKFSRLHAALVNEKANIEARLNEIAKVLGGGHSTATATASIPATKERKKRKMSAAGKAAIVAAQKARWAKIKAAKAKA